MHGTIPPSLNTLLRRSLRVEACKKIISSFKVNTFTNVDLATCYATVARGKLELMKLSLSDFY